MLLHAGNDAAIFNNALNKLGSPALENYSSKLTTFSNSKIKPLEYFEVSIMIDDEEFITNAYVVENISMSQDVILGF